jgi:membrane protease YdiL (CAAX protease family)
MRTIIAFIRTHPQHTFWAIAFSTFTAGVFLGGTWFLLIYGTFLGGALVTGISQGRNALKEYFARIVRWRVGVKWYAIAFLLPLLLNLAAFEMSLVFGASPPTSPAWPSLTSILAVFLWPGFLGISLAEEPGFRGFALPHYLKSHTALKAALVIGTLHAAWHFPLLVGMYLEGQVINIFSTATVIVCASVFFTWLLNNTRNSVLICMLLHASEDLWTGEGQALTFGPLLANFTSAELVRQDVFQAVTFTIAAAAMLYLTNFKLGSKQITSRNPSE